MNSKPLAFAVIALAISIMACGVQTNTGAMLANALPTHTAKPLAGAMLANALPTHTAKPLASATPTQETAITVGSWHIRAAANASAQVIGYAMDGTKLSIIAQDGDWMLVQIIDEDPAECLAGYVHRNALGK